MRTFTAFTLASLVILSVSSAAQFAGQNVNMVSGTQWPYGDPFLERQNEPSIAVSTRNPLHLLAGANDYRTVDLNLPESDVGEGSMTGAPTGEPWVGQYISTDGGARWQSTLLPGYPQDTSVTGVSSPVHGFTTAADPVIAAGTNGLFYYGGIAFNRGTSLGVVFVARFMDLNNKENGAIAQDSFPIRYVNTVPVAYGTLSPAHFLDKPAIAVDIPRSTRTCTLSVPQGGATVSQTVPAGNVYVAYANVASTSAGTTSTIYFSRSLNCGADWSKPQPISRGYAISQGATIQIDPETGIVYVAWRVIHNGTTQPNDGVAIAASLDGGSTFLPGITLVNLPPFNPNNPTAAAFFDQGTTGSSFRTTAYPALAVADSGLLFIPGPVYLAWSQRGVGPNGEARIMMLALPGNSSITSSGFSPPTPFPVDNGAVTNDVGGTFSNLTSGHQIMPAMTFNQGKLMVLYYDLRQDHTTGLFDPSVSNGQFVPDTNGDFFEETRQTVAEIPNNLYSPYFISDAGLTVRRHTMDVVLAQSNLALVPSFTYTRVSHYDFGLFEGETSPEFHQIKYNPPNLPMFQLGTAAFMGDYVGITGQPFVLVKCGSSKCWTYNNPLPSYAAGSFLAAPKPAPSSAVHYAAWTSNQDVIPPPNNRWDTYTSISGGTSVYNGESVPPCTPGLEGDRNQNVYSSRINQGLVVSSPQDSKPLSTTVQRGLVVLVQNQTTGRVTSSGRVNYFRLTIANQPVNGFASFSQFVPPALVPPPPFPATNNGMPFPLTSIDAAIAPHTGIARTVFAVSSNPTASILVNVNEIDSLGGNLISGGLSGFLLLNADGTVPTSLVDPNGQTGSNSINGVELYNPNVSAPNVSAPNVSAPNVSAPNVSAPNVSAPNVSAPNVSAPNVSAPNVSAYGVANPNVSAPNVSAPNVSAAPPSDGTFPLTNTGNTHVSLNVFVTGSTTTPLQLLLSQIYMTPQTDGNCNLITQQQNITLTNVPNVPLTPLNQLGNPNVSAAPVTASTLSLAPGDTAYITLRGNVDIPTMQQILTQVTPVIVPQAINSNNATATTPPIIAPLFITTSSLPAGTVGQAYPTTMLSAIGGKTSGVECSDYFWSWTGNPPGLTLSGNTISGTPTTAGLYNVQLQVQDCAGVRATRQLSLLVIAPLAFTPPALQTVSINQAFSEDLSSFTSGGLPPYTYTISAGSLPAGFTLNGSTISGMSSALESSSFSVKVSDAQATPATVTQPQTISVINPVTITSITPSTAADGFGQTVTIVTTGVPDPTQARVTFTQNTFSADGFLLQSASTPNTLFVRLPSGLTGGAATVVVTNTMNNLFSAPAAMTVSGGTPGTPALNGIFGLTTPPTAANSYCGSGISASPITSVSEGQGILVSAFGIDTTNSTVEFRQGDSIIVISPRCSITNGTVGIAVPVVVPAGFSISSPLYVSINTRVGDFTSAYSNEIQLTLSRTISSIAVTPGSGSLTLGQTQQFTATATYNDSTQGDVTSVVTWSSSDTRLSIDGTGFAHAYNEDDPLGTANGGASAGDVISATLGFRSGATQWHVNLLAAVGGVLQPYSCSLEGHLMSLSGSNGPTPASTQTSINFVNNTHLTRQVFWLNYSGARYLYNTTLLGGTSYLQPTYLTHPWVIADTIGNCLEIYINPDITGTGTPNSAPTN